MGQSSVTYSGIEFERVGEIRPRRDDHRALERYDPERPAAGEKRHAHADGPFGRFEVPRAPNVGGVFAISVDGGLVYVGETSDIARLAGPMGFGAVTKGKLAPKGPMTNCRLNGLLFEAASRGRRAELWLHRAKEREQRRALREHIKASLAPAWNKTAGSNLPAPLAEVEPPPEVEVQVPTRQIKPTRIADIPGFEFVGRIEPECDPTGDIIEDQPHLRFDNRAEVGLVPHGEGPFCRFAVEGLPAYGGIYAVVCDGDVVYVGICANLRQRYGPTGYATISPRNCFTGGQSTNCRINHFILNAAKAARTCELWFLAEPDGDLRRAREAVLIRDLRPAWNRQS